MEDVTLAATGGSWQQGPLSCRFSSPRPGQVHRHLQIELSKMPGSRSPTTPNPGSGALRFGQRDTLRPVLQPHQEASISGSAQAPGGSPEIKRP